ncbi:T9SS type A sorting domain-containing protein [Kaistella sp. DKR-2]|uniref:T9SS type A sorting domain-containing protein n=1 Tax=Kaistella soli TaxID=2849654 RepID=UPI001C26F31A|nr:T9SS type A sorting domain-containing protein [Kaistella soli]MBU8883507.1 T9SS type A sorting domain-containing protein [Kaistella soli]
MKNISIGVFFLFSLQFFAQESKTVWQKDLKSSTQDFLSAMTPTLDRQILLAGSSINQKPKQLATGLQQQNRGYDYHVVKLDQNGNTVWDKYFGGTRHDYLISSVATQEGGFLLAGTSFSNQAGEKKASNIGGSDVWIIRLDENGEELWQQTLGTTGNDEASAVVQAADQGFFVAGNISSSKQLFGSKDVFVSKLNKDGKLMQTTVLGGKGLDEVTAMIPTEDGGSLIAIYSTSGTTENKVYTSPAGQHYPTSAEKPDSKSTQNFAADLLMSLQQTSDQGSQQAQDPIQLQGKSEDNFGAGDYWIVKLDKNARIQWQKSYGGTRDDRPKSLAFTEKGYLISGESRSSSSGNKKENIKEGTDIWVISLDKDGNELWQKNYSFGNRDIAMSLDVFRKSGKNNQSEDRGFLIGGYTQAEEKIHSDDEKFWMLYIDTNGKEEWRKHVEGKSRKKEERLVSAKLQNDGNFLLAGTSAEELGQENWKIIKLGSKELENLIEKQEIRIYPNPVEDYAYVEIGFEFQGEADISLHDLSGKLVQTLKTQKGVTKINTSSLLQGLYIVTAKTQNKNVNVKIIKK